MCKIQHWSYGSFIQYIGVLGLALFFLFVVIEILRSQKAKTTLKFAFAIAYVLLPLLGSINFPAIVLIFAAFILGTVYLQNFRKKFLYRHLEASRVKSSSKE